MRNQMLVRALACVALLGGLAACGDDPGSDGAEESDRISVTPADDSGEHDHSTHDHGTSGEMSGMTGDPAATPADELSGADLREGEFALLPDAPAASPEVSGTAYLATTDEGTTLSVEVSGLEAGGQYMSHLHAEACEPDAGGDHFKFDPDGSDQPPNEVHLVVPANARGTAATTITNDNPDSAGAKSMVLHLDDGTKFACADLS